MATLRLTSFIGEIAKLIPRLLPPNAAQNAFDVRLEDGSLAPLRESVTTYSTPGLPTASPATIYLHDGDWLAWDSRVNAAPGPVATDRLYFTGDGVPKVRIAGVDYTMAITAPTVALTPAAPTGVGSGTAVTTIWVYTNVSQFGEESEPCPASAESSWQAGQSISLSGFSTTMGDRTATYQRIYRSQTSSAGVTSFFLEAERAAGTGAYVSAFANTLSDALPSLTWNNPPADMHSLTSMPNGMMAALSGKELCFCEPYYPHAWPEEYRLTLDYDGVGLGAYGSSLAVLTTGNPYIAQGTHPDSVAMDKLELNLPCVNAAAIVDMGYAIAYPSHDGLVLVSAGGPRLATEQLLSRDDWQELVPAAIVAGQYNGRYIASYSYFNEVDEQNYDGTLSLDIASGQPFFMRNTVRAIAYFYDVTTGLLYYLQDGVIYQWDPNGGANKTYSWRSKEFVLPKPTNFGAILIEADTMTAAEQAALNALIADIEAQNAVIFTQDSIGGEINGGAINEYAINGDDLVEVPASAGTVTVNIYADKALVATISDTNTMKRLPSGFMARIWEIEVTANVVVSQVAISGTGLELAQVE